MIEDKGIIVVRMLFVVIIIIYLFDSIEVLLNVNSCLEYLKVFIGDFWWVMLEGVVRFNV